MKTIIKNQFHTIGVISDTHGLLRNRIKEAFKDVSLIIHAGDIDTPDILGELEKIAPVTAVKGNMDFMGRVGGLPKTDLIEFAGIFIYIIHDLQKIDLDPAAAGVSVVVFGHTHQPTIYEKNGIYYINPGSAGPKRPNRPVTLGLLNIQNSRIHPEILDIND